MTLCLLAQRQQMLLRLRCRAGLFQGLAQAHLLHEKLGIELRSVLVHIQATLTQQVFAPFDRILEGVVSIVDQGGPLHRQALFPLRSLGKTIRMQAALEMTVTL